MDSHYFFLNKKEAENIFKLNSKSNHSIPFIVNSHDTKKLIQNGEAVLAIFQFD